MTIIYIAQKNIARRTTKESITSREPPAAIYWDDLTETEKMVLTENRKLKARLTDRSFSEYMALWARYNIKLKNEKAFNKIHECILDQGLNPFAVWLYGNEYRAEYRDGNNEQGWFHLAGK